MVGQPRDPSVGGVSLEDALTTAAASNNRTLAEYPARVMSDRVMFKVNRWAP